MFCPKCGKEVGDDDQFCSNCNAPIPGRVIETIGGRTSPAENQNHTNLDDELARIRAEQSAARTNHERPKQGQEKLVCVDDERRKRKQEELRNADGWKRRQEDIRKLRVFTKVWKERAAIDFRENAYITEGREILSGVNSVHDYISVCRNTHDIIIKIGLPVVTGWAVYSVMARMGYVKAFAGFGIYIVYYLSKGTYLRARGAIKHYLELRKFDTENKEILNFVPKDLWNEKNIDYMITNLEQGKVKSISEAIYREREIREIHKSIYGF